MSVRKLLAALLMQAVRDWWAARAGMPTKIARQVALKCGYGEDCPREVLDFFRSAWCQEICLELGIDYGAMLDRLGVVE